VPAAAVIPAPIAYIKVVAVKKLVVGSQSKSGGPLKVVIVWLDILLSRPVVLLTGCHGRSVRLL
jgi:hypothetical protein